MIIQSTTLDTESKVKAIYGQNTQWISHSGYVLRGASSGVTANDATKTGGSDNSIVPYHRHSVSRAILAESAGSHVHGVKFDRSGAQATGYGLTPSPGFQNLPLVRHSDNSYSTADSLIENTGAHTHYISAHNTNYAGTSENTTNANIPNYKSVYIWERIA